MSRRCGRSVGTRREILHPADCHRASPESHLRNANHARPAHSRSRYHCTGGGGTCRGGEASVRAVSGVDLWPAMYQDVGICNQPRAQCAPAVVVPYHCYRLGLTTISSPRPFIRYLQCSLQLACIRNGHTAPHSKTRCYKLLLQTLVLWIQ